MANSNEKMKVGLSFNGKSVEVELTQEQLKELGLVEEKKTGYERVARYDTYYAPTIHCGYTGYTDMHRGDSNIFYNQAHYYSDATICRNNDRADMLMRGLRRFAAENGGIPSKEDWKNYSIYKYYITYDYDDEEIFVSDAGTNRGSFQIYFNSQEACEKAIEEFRGELLWYFTKYQAMLY